MVEESDEDELARDLLVAKYERTPGSLRSWRLRALPVAVDLTDLTAQPATSPPPRAE